MADPQTTPQSGSPDPSPAGQQPAAQAAASNPTPATTTRPEYIPEKFWDAEKGVKAEDLTKHLSELETFKAEQDIRRSGVPEAPEKYAITAKVEGFEFDEKDPLLGFARAFAHENGIPQEGFDKLVASYAQMQVERATAEAKQFEDFRTESMAKLGANGAARVEALQTAIVGRLGAEDAAHVIPLLVSEKQVVAMEKLMRSGVTPFSASGRQAEPQKIAPEQYEAMSPAQKLLYARSARAAGGQR
jgi:hypothetical protein